LSEILKSINWSTVVASGLVAVIVGSFQLVAQRYTNHMLDRVDKKLGIIKKEDKL